MAEIEFGTADGSDEIKVYDEVQDYLASGRFPETAMKVDKGVIRKRAIKFLLPVYTMQFLLFCSFSINFSIEIS